MLPGLFFRLLGAAAWRKEKKKPGEGEEESEVEGKLVGAGSGWAGVPLLGPFNLIFKM